MMMMMMTTTTMMIMIFAVARVGMVFSRYCDGSDACTVVVLVSMGEVLASMGAVLTTWCVCVCIEKG